MDAGLYQGVRCFLSIDLVGSTGLKSDPKLSPTRKTAIDPEQRDWVDIHVEFYQECLDRLVHDEQEHSDRPKVDEADDGHTPWDVSNRLHFWRVRGDEVLLYSGRIGDPQQMFDILYRFCRVVRDLDDRFSKAGLGAKGCMWAGGFPIRNREILISTAPPYFRSLSRGGVNKEAMRQAPFFDFGRTSWLEFAGPEIDLGFMIAPYINPARVVVSIEVANFVALCPLDLSRQIHIHHVGWRSLKTLYDGTPYPILWADARLHDAPKKRVSFEGALSDLSETFFDPKSRLNPKAVQELHRDYLNDTAERYGRIDMYLKPGDAPSSDERIWESIERERK